MEDRRRRIAHIIIQIIQRVGEFLLMGIVVVAIIIAAYALWDVHDVAQRADPIKLEKYKPKEDKKSFEELVGINDEVIGWIDIYGTNIDYPVVQAEDNDKYLSISAEGKYSLSGSIFLDYRNKPDFSDFNSIIHGHNMSYNVMFGDVSDFMEKEFFETHKYGDLFFDGKHHGLRILGVVEVDAYRSGLYQVLISTDESKNRFFEEIDECSIYAIDEAEKELDYHYVLLSTCTTAMTNGRHILICRLTDEVYENIYADDNSRNKDTVVGARTKIRFFLILLVIIALLIGMATAIKRAEKREREARRREVNGG